MRSPAFQFYPADYLADMKVRMLSWASRGLYMELICYCWREGWIPSDSSAIAQLCGCHDLAIVEPCLKLFISHPSDPSKLIHGRLQEEIEKQEKHREERVESGKKGAEARWNKGKAGRKKHDSSANGSAILLPMAKNGSSSSTSTSSSISKSKDLHAPDGTSSDPVPVVISWTPENGFDGITEADRSDWAKAFPAVNLEMQIARAHTWLKDNPAKRKKAVRRFLSNWFGRCQEKGGDIASTKPAHRQEKAEREYEEKPKPIPLLNFDP